MFHPTRIGPDQNWDMCSLGSSTRRRGRSTFKHGGPTRHMPNVVARVEVFKGAHARVDCARTVECNTRQVKGNKAIFHGCSRLTGTAPTKTENFSAKKKATDEVEHGEYCTQRAYSRIQQPRSCQSGPGLAPNQHSIQKTRANQHLSRRSCQSSPALAWCKHFAQKKQNKNTCLSGSIKRSFAWRRPDT